MQSRPYVPIFGCRKRTQRQAAYANPEEVDMLSSSNALTDEQMCKIDFSTTSQRQYPRHKTNRMNNLSNEADHRTFYQTKNTANHQSDFSSRNLKRRDVFLERDLGNESSTPFFKNQESSCPKTSRFETMSRSSKTTLDHQQITFPFNRNKHINRDVFEDDVEEKFQVKKFKQSQTAVHCNSQIQENSKQSANYSKANLQSSVDVKPKIDKTKSKGNYEVPRFLSVQIGSLQKWNKCLNDSNVVFELVGILDSTIAYNIAGVEKRFTLKDQTGSIRCVFWEIDRKIPQLRRGNLIRCVGMYKETVVQCVSVRAVSPSEENLLKKAQKQCEMYLQRFIKSSTEM